MISVAIDGPAGAGKSTVARLLSKKLGFLYFDTGALYRVLGYYFIINNLDYKDKEIISKHLNEINISFQINNRQQKMFLNNNDVTYNIRNDEVSMVASEISSIPIVRQYLLNMQREVAKNNNVVMDGRDIGTVVLPNADVKIFLTADLRVRANRRWRQLKKTENCIRFNQVIKMVAERDRNDRTRKISPLIPAKDAIFISTTRSSLYHTVNKLATIVKRNINEKK